MPTKPKQFFALLIVGGIAALSANIATNVTKQQDGLGGFAATTVGGALGAGLGIMVLSGTGVRLA